MKTAVNLRGYSCRVDGYGHETVVNAPSAGKARYQHWLDVRDVDPDLKIMSIRVRSIGAPVTSDALRSTGEYRHLQLPAGARVEVRGLGMATVADSGGSANFLVWFDRGGTGCVHPVDIVGGPR